MYRLNFAKNIVEKNLCKDKLKDVIHHWQSLHLRNFIKSFFEQIKS